MWLFTTKGFFSVVTADGEGDNLMIRARVRGDLENLKREHEPGLKILDSAGTDYRYRAIIERRVFLNILVELGDEITYRNFKDEVKAQQGKKRYKAYTQVWSVMVGLQPFRPWPSRKTSIGAIRNRTGTEPMDTEEFERHFGSLPTTDE